MSARVVALAVVTALLATGCYGAHEEPMPPQNADERLADRVISALMASDMRPVLPLFVPERKDVLLDPMRVKDNRGVVGNAGTFLGAREVNPLADQHSNLRHFIAYFEKDNSAVIIQLDDAGKIVHFHIGPGPI